MTKSIIIFFNLLFVSALAFAQEGFMHHKNHFDFSVSGNIPLVSGSFKQKEFKPSGDEMIASKDWLDYGANFSYHRVMSKRISLGLFASFKNYELSMPSNYTSLYSAQKGNKIADTTHLRFQSLGYRNLYIGPSLEFTSKKGTSGIGFTYDLSVGVSVSALRNSNYAYTLNEFTDAGDDDRWSSVDYYQTEFEWGNTFGIYAQTGFKIRYPIADFISLYTGFRYTIVVNSKPDTFIDNSDSDVFNHEDVYFQIQRENLFTATLDFGVTFYL
jgi:hypothetical protein